MSIARLRILAVLIDRLSAALEAALDDAIVAGYRRVPPAEDSWIAAGARESIAVEPW